MYLRFSLVLIDRDIDLSHSAELRRGGDVMDVYINTGPCK